jgi:dCMP deaminase
LKEKHIKAYMKTAETFAECSTATRLHVGAIIVKDDRIISIGYNGMPSGWDNNCEYKFVHPQTKIPELVTRKEVLHAEANALAKVARSSESSEGAVMFITHSPCFACAKLIYQSGISKVYFGQHYRETDGVNFLKKCNIDVEQVDV